MTINLKVTERFTDLWDAANLAGDDNACSVVAVAMVANCKYSEAYSVLQACGRKRGKGALVSQMQSALRLLGVQVEHMNPTGLTVRQSLARYCNHDAVGFCVTKGHVTAYGYGSVRDTNAVLDSECVRLFRITNQYERGNI